MVVPRSVWERRLTRLKECGVNAIRTAHTPFPSEFYSGCDQLASPLEGCLHPRYPARRWSERREGGRLSQAANRRIDVNNEIKEITVTASSEGLEPAGVTITKRIMR